MIVGFSLMYFFIRKNRVSNSYSSISTQHAPTYQVGTTQSIAAIDSLGNINSISFPTGMIMIWYPPDTSLKSLSLLTIASVSMGVPTGWAICDGTKGTPDLRGRFVLMAQDTVPEGSPAGSSVHPIMSKGGEQTHVLTEAEMPNHIHNTRHLNTADGYGGGNQALLTIGPPNLMDNGFGSLMAPAGGNSPHNNMPPYYTLVYIMKL
jgi:microcystin-dependent protein